MYRYEAVQVRPQNVHISLRVNEAYDLDFYYKQAEDYPVDLYYLMDLSKSMEDDKEKLSALGDLLAETMQNITSNFRYKIFIEFLLVFCCIPIFACKCL